MNDARALKTDVVDVMQVQVPGDPTESDDIIITIDPPPEDLDLENEPMESVVYSFRIRSGHEDGHSYNNNVDFTLNIASSIFTEIAENEGIIGANPRSIENAIDQATELMQKMLSDDHLVNYPRNITLTISAVGSSADKPVKVSVGQEFMNIEIELIGFANARNQDESELIIIDDLNDTVRAATFQGLLEYNLQSIILQADIANCLLGRGSSSFITQKNTQGLPDEEIEFEEPILANVRLNHRICIY